jgi:hypothetical protein
MTRWTILTLSQKWVKLLKHSGLYHRPVSDIRGHIYNSFAGGIVQVYVVPVDILLWAQFLW